MLDDQAVPIQQDWRSRGREEPPLRVPAAEIHVLQGDLLGDVAIPCRRHREIDVSQATALPVVTGGRQVMEQAIQVVAGHPLSRSARSILSLFGGGNR